MNDSALAALPTDSLLYTVRIFIAEKGSKNHSKISLEPSSSKESHCKHRRVLGNLRCLCIPKNTTPQAFAKTILPL